MMEGTQAAVTRGSINENGESDTAAETAQKLESLKTALESLKRINTSRLEDLEKMLDQKDASPAEMSRIVAREMAAILRAMNIPLDEPSLKMIYPSANAAKAGEVSLFLKYCEAQYKGVRELGRQIGDMETLSKRDFINWEGAKFAYVVGRLATLGADCLRLMGQNEHNVNNWLAHWRHQLEEQIGSIAKDADNLFSNK